MTRDELKTRVFEALGTASMCWVPRPSIEVFDSVLAEQVGNELWADIEKFIDGPVSDVPEIPERVPFEIALERMINIHSKEKESNTPNFILAQFMNNCLQAFNHCVKRREEWYHHMGNNH